MYYLLIIKYLNEQSNTGKYYELIRVSNLKKHLIEDLARADIKYSSTLKVYSAYKKCGRENIWYGPEYLIVNEKDFNLIKSDVSNYFGK